MDLAAVNSHPNAVTLTVSVTKRTRIAPTPVHAPKTVLADKSAHVVNVGKSVVLDVVVHLVNSANVALVSLAAKLTPIVPPIKAVLKVNAPTRVQISQHVAVMHSALSPIIACFVTAPMVTKESPARNAYNLNAHKIATVNRINVVMRVNVVTHAWNMVRAVLMHNAVWWTASHNVHAHPITLAHPKPSVAHWMAVALIIHAALIPNALRCLVAMSAPAWTAVWVMRTKVASAKDIW